MSSQTGIGDAEAWGAPTDEADQDTDCWHHERWTVAGECVRCEPSVTRDPYDGLEDAAKGRSAGGPRGGQR